MLEKSLNWDFIVNSLVGPFSALFILIAIIGFIGFAAWRILNKVLPVVLKAIEETNDWKTTFENMSEKANVVAEKVSKMEEALSTLAKSFRDFRVETKEAHSDLRSLQEKQDDEIHEIKLELAIMKTQYEKNS